MIPKGGIAFFDSGIGGLTVLAECKKHLPNELFYYYGDNNYAPYGNRSEQQIFKRVKKAMRLFCRLKVKAVVLACNTVTAVCVDALRKKYSFPIIGAEPAVQLAAKSGGEIFILVTRATYESQRFRRLCNKVAEKYPMARLRAFACDGLAGAIEKNITKEDFDYSPYLPEGNPTYVVLGCTHYIYIKSQLQERYQCEVLDGNEGIARRLIYSLNHNNIRAHTPKKEKSCFLQPFLTTKVEKDKNTNKCSHEYKRKKHEISTNGKVFFLRKTKGFNENIYKQMFVLGKNGHEDVCGGQKNKKN